MSDKPRVLNRKDTKDYPAGAFYVARPSIYGNPFLIGRDGTREEVIEKYKEYLENNHQLRDMFKKHLKGKDLVCWCAPKACHADVLLEIANED